MTTLLYSHPACFAHDPGPGHPESPDRLRAVLKVLENPEFAAIERREAPIVSVDDILRVHGRAHFDRIMTGIPQSGYAALDGDTILSPGSGEAALRAAGALCAAVDAVVAGEARNSFCAIRPPGHHAEPDQAMGFCLFNNVAIGALHARAVHGIGRIAIVDFDVHHGNGTQAAFEADANVFFASTHQSPLYPGTGGRGETGVGNILNLPLPPGAGSAEFRNIFKNLILPELDSFRPGIILVSAGFDAHRRDPLAQLNLTEEDFGWATQMLATCAGRLCEGRLVSTLEGGYDLAALAASAAAHLRALMAG